METQATAAQAPPVFEAHEPAIAPSRAKRLYLILGGVAVALLLIYGLYFLLTSGKETTDDAQVAADVVPVAPRVAGQILRVAVAENQLVHKGDLIAEIDPRDLQAKEAQALGDAETARAQALQSDARMKIAEANAIGGLAVAQATVSGSREGVDASTDAIAEMRAGLTRAEANSEKARLDYKRAEELGAKGDISRSQVDSARAAAQTAEADVAQARAKLQSANDAKERAMAGLAQSQGQLQQSSQVPALIAAARAEGQLAHAKLQSSEAALAAAQLNLSYTKVYAPADGYAARLSIHPGQLVTQGQPLCQLVPQHTYVVANFKETQVRNMRPGQTATIDADAAHGRSFEGKVESISGGTGSSFSVLPADNASGNFVKVVQRIAVRIAWNGPPSSETPVGSSATVTVKTK